MNLNDELQISLRNVKLAGYHGTCEAFMVSAMVSGKITFDCQGDFSDLFELLFCAAEANEPVKGLVLAVAEALKSRERMLAEQERKNN